VCGQTSKPGRCGDGDGALCRRRVPGGCPGRNTGLVGATMAPPGSVILNLGSLDGHRRGRRGLFTGSRGGSNGRLGPGSCLASGKSVRARPGVSRLGDSGWGVRHQRRRGLRVLLVGLVEGD
jgi:hypothetical protein